MDSSVKWRAFDPGWAGQWALARLVALRRRSMAGVQVAESPLERLD